MIWVHTKLETDKAKAIKLSHTSWRVHIRTQTIGIVLNTVSVCMNLYVIFPPNHWTNLVNVVALGFASWGVWHSTKRLEELHKITIDAAYDLAFTNGKLDVIRPTYRVG